MLGGRREKQEGRTLLCVGDRSLRCKRESTFTETSFDVCSLLSPTQTNVLHSLMSVTLKRAESAQR